VLDILAGAVGTSKLKFTVLLNVNLLVCFDMYSLGRKWSQPHEW